MKKILSLVLGLACWTNIVCADFNDIFIADAHANVITVYNNPDESAVLRAIIEEEKVSFFKKHKVALMCAMGGIAIIVGVAVGLVCDRKKKEKYPTIVWNFPDFPLQPPVIPNYIPPLDINLCKDPVVEDSGQ